MGTAVAVCVGVAVGTCVGVNVGGTGVGEGEGDAVDVATATTTVGSSLDGVVVACANCTGSSGARSCGVFSGTGVAVTKSPKLSSVA